MNRKFTTVKEALLGASFLLREAGVPQARREAEILLSSCLEAPLARLYAHGEETVCSTRLERYLDWCRRRAAGEPSAYIRGTQEFMGLDFSVNSEVLIPRPETEVLAEFIISELRDVPAPRILEVGTGSGAIAVSLAAFLPAAMITACDISSAALAVAKKNAAANGVEDRIRFLCGDLYTPVSGCSFDAVVSNPPYIATGQIELLGRNVREYEPLSALDGGKDGLDFYRRLTGELGVLDAAPPLLAFEVGIGQADEVAGLCLLAGYKNTGRIKDLAGIERVITAAF